MATVKRVDGEITPQRIMRPMFPLRGKSAPRARRGCLRRRSDCDGVPNTQVLLTCVGTGGTWVVSLSCDDARGGGWCINPGTRHLYKMYGSTSIRQTDCGKRTSNGDEPTAPTASPGLPCDGGFSLESSRRVCTSSLDRESLVTGSRTLRATGFSGIVGLVRNARERTKPLAPDNSA